MALLDVMRPQLDAWPELSQFERKRLLRLAIETAYLRKNALAALEPSVAFLPLIRHQPYHTLSGCSPLAGGNTLTAYRGGEGGRSSTCYTEEPIILSPGTPVKDALLIIDYRQKKSTDPGNSV